LVFFPSPLPLSTTPLCLFRSFFLFATSTYSFPLYLSLSLTLTQTHNDNNFDAEFRPCNCDRLCLLFSRILMNFQRRRRSHDIGDLYKHNMSLNGVFIAINVRRHVITVRPLDLFFFFLQTGAFIDLFEKVKKLIFWMSSPSICFIWIHFKFNPNHFIWNISLVVFSFENLWYYNIRYYLLVFYIY